MEDKLQIDESQYGLSITIKWFKWVAVFLLFFCFAWNSFLFGFYSMGDTPWFVYAFTSVHLAVGIGLSYFTLALFINKTYVHVDRGQIKIQHAPLPWIGSKTIDATQITQLYVREVKNKGKKGAVSYTYELRAKFQNGLSTVVVGSSVMDDADVAHILEEKIEHYLGIDDQPVKGEHGAI